MTYLFRLARHRLGDSCRRRQIAGPGTVHTCMAGMADMSGMGIGGGPGSSRPLPSSSVWSCSIRTTMPPPRPIPHDLPGRQRCHKRCLAQRDHCRMGITAVTGCMQHSLRSASAAAGQFQARETCIMLAGQSRTDSVSRLEHVRAGPVGEARGAVERSQAPGKAR